MITWEEVAEYQVTWGSPSTVLGKLVALRDLTGPFGMLTMMAHEYHDGAFFHRSMRMLASDALPVLTQHAEAAE